MSSYHKTQNLSIFLGGFFEVPFIGKWIRFWENFCVRNEPVSGLAPHTLLWRLVSGGGGGTPSYCDKLVSICDKLIIDILTL